MRFEQQLLERTASLGYHWPEGVLHSTNRSNKLYFPSHDSIRVRESTHACNHFDIFNGFVWGSASLVSNDNETTYAS